MNLALKTTLLTTLAGLTGCLAHAGRAGRPTCTDELLDKFVEVKGVDRPYVRCSGEILITEEEIQKYSLPSHWVDYRVLTTECPQRLIVQGYYGSAFNGYHENVLERTGLIQGLVYMGMPDLPRGHGRLRYDVGIRDIFIPPSTAQEMIEDFCRQ